MLFLTCPNCKERFRTKYHKNRWVSWFEGYCETCGYKFILKDKEFDFVQPEHPLFSEIYKDKPYEKLKKEKQARDWQKENQKSDREVDLNVKVKQGKLKPWELKDVKKIAEDRGLN